MNELALLYLKFVGSTGIGTHFNPETLAFLRQFLSDDRNLKTVYDAMVVAYAVYNNQVGNDILVIKEDNEGE